MYKNILELTKEAENNHTMVGAFNVHNLEMLPDMIRAAQEMKAPIIIQTSIDTAKYIGYKVLVTIVKTMAVENNVDIALHLDHARDFDEIKAAIQAGYNSVMYDGSHLPIEENIKHTREVVEYAHAHNVAVEGEIGTIGGTEEGIHVDENDKQYTDPQQAKYFVEQTGCDILAIGCGTNHGQFSSKAELNIPLVAEIRDTVHIPLVIHGGTGVKESDYEALCNAGIRKFNVGTEQLVTWTRVAKQSFLETKVNKSLRYNVIPANEAVKEVVKHKIELFLGEH